MSTVLFVYGTLMPGQPRWDLLQRYAADPGWPAQVRGRLFDTGHGYPVADLVPDGSVPDGSVPDGSVPDGSVPDGLVRGHCVPLLDMSRTQALAALDRYEEVDLGLYTRIRLTTHGSTATTCWAYTLGPRGTEHFTALRPIPSGDWALHLSR